MEHLPNYYTTLFNAVTDALTALSCGDNATAQTILIQGQQDAEELYLTETDQV